MHVSRHPELFCSGRGGTNIGDIPQEMAEFLGSIINMDDPRHKKLRGLVSSGFRPEAAQPAARPGAGPRATSVIDAVAEKGECDFVARDRRARCRCRSSATWSACRRRLEQTCSRRRNIILGVGDPEYVQTYEDLMGAFMTLHQMAMELGQHRLDNPTDDITSILMHAEVDGERLTVPEFASFFILLVVAGNETTRTAISHGMLALQNNPDQKALWMSDFDRYAQDAVEEIVRWATPVIHFRRTATAGHRDRRPSDQGGREGRDVLQLGEPRRAPVRPTRSSFDITRSPNPHVGYGGGGPHFCLGANLARREIRVMFEELFRAAPRPRDHRRARHAAVELHPRHQAHALRVHPDRAERRAIERGVDRAPTFVLVASPLVGPAGWRWLATELSSRGSVVRARARAR